MTEPKDLKLAKQKRLVRAATVGLEVVLGIGACFSGLTVAGGVIVAATATLPVVALAGWGSALLGFHRIAGAVRNILNSEETVTSFFKKNDDAPKSNADFVKTLTQSLNFDAPKWMQKPLAKLGMAGLTLGVGIVLWPVGGFLATAASVWMVTSGGFGTLSAGVQTLTEGPFGKSAPDATLTVTTSNKAEGSAPASKLNDLAAKADFKAAANTNEPAATVEAKPAADVKPPKVG